MKIALPLCFLLACGAMSSEVAFAAAHHHRPGAAAHPGAASDNAAKSSAAPSAPADVTPAPSAAGSTTGDTGPIDTSITVNQGHIRETTNHDTGKHSVFKPKNGTIEPTIIGHTKPHLPPVHSVADRAPAHRNAVGAVVEHVTSHAAKSPVAPATATPPSHPGAMPTSVSGTAPPAPKSPSAISAESNEHGAAVLKTVTASGAVINGTGVAKPSMAAAAVGGPAKPVATAAVGGASFRPRHP
jgi:hypothetical protein